MDKNWLIKFNFSLNFMVAPKFQVKVKNFDINGSNEFLSTKMSKSLKHYSSEITTMRKSHARNYFIYFLLTFHRLSPG